MLTLLDVIAKPDEVTKGDFWRDQPFVKLPKDFWPGKPESFQEIAGNSSLQGIRIAVPAMYIGGPSPEGAEPVYTCEAVSKLWEETKKDLEALGAEVVVVPDFPAVTGYENPQLLPDGCPQLPPSWASMERGQLIAHAWNDFLKANKDNKTPDITALDPLEIYPDRLRTSAELKHLPPTNHIHYTRLAEYVQGVSMYDIKDMATALQTLETLRERLFDDYLTENKCDCYAFPAAGDVGAADADIDETSAEHAWKNGVKFSNGNRALRHLGIPTVSVPMGVIPDKKVPVNLTFAGRAYEDVGLLRWANAFEKATRRRTKPEYTPPLESDIFAMCDLKGQNSGRKAARPELVVQKCEVVRGGFGGPAGAVSTSISLQWTVRIDEDRLESQKSDPVVEVTVDGSILSPTEIEVIRAGDRAGDNGTFVFKADLKVCIDESRDKQPRTEAPVAGDRTMIVILARSVPAGRPSGWLGLV